MLKEHDKKIIRSEHIFFLVQASIRNMLEILILTDGDNLNFTTYKYGDNLLSLLKNSTRLVNTF